MTFNNGPYELIKRGAKQDESDQEVIPDLSTHRQRHVPDLHVHSSK
jgi:hypothetical protein